MCPRQLYSVSPIYLKALRKLEKLGVQRIMSRELSEFVNIEPTTIRRDFSFLGSLGKQGYGYDVTSLIEIFDGELGGNFHEKLIIVGAGNLGKALMNYNRWNHVVGEIVCAFDIAPEKAGEVYQIPVYPLDQIHEKMPEGVSYCDFNDL